MAHFPSFDEFCQYARSSNLIPIYRRLTSDILTPVSAFCKIREGEHSFLFESVVGGERHGRYSFLGSGPFARIDAYESQVNLVEGNLKKSIETRDPLGVVEEALRKYQSPQIAGLPRFSGGAVGYAGYDTIRYVEHLPNPPQDDRKLPDLSFAFYDRMVIFDHVTKTVAVVCHAHVDRNDLEKSYQHACQRVDQLVERLQQGVADLQLTDVDPTGKVTLNWTSNFDPQGFIQIVERAKEYIRAGDIFQIVLSQRLKTTTRARPFDIYRALRVVNPSPFMFYLQSGNTHLVGASPEIMTRVENRQVTIRPLAGTRRRGQNADEDQQLEKELLADPKERAEHVMLVDLGRNDVGRIAEIGSVKLSELMTVERYSHVMHISSTVTGTLGESKNAFDALRSCLPAGTLSGAPKIRAMEIIDELEPHRRGPYGGAVGYIDFSGNMDTCIALRTMVIQGQTVYVQAGAGIVADSQPEEEYQETLNKAMGLLRALQVAEEQL